LATSLLAEKAYPLGAFAKLYARRWGIEKALSRGLLNMNNSHSHTQDLLKVAESLLGLLVALGLIIGAILFVFFGLMDITDSSRISLEANHLLVGSVGLLLVAAHIYGYIGVRKRNAAKELTAAASILILSATFAYISPARLGILFGAGDPAQWAAFWSGSTGILLLLLVAAEKATGRSN
jgi:hypothetical protein